jgi:calcineurin-like phosphoesterase family protein
MKIRLRVLSVLLLASLAAGCTGGNSAPPVTPTPTPNPNPQPIPTPSPPITFIGAGDIADCSTTVSGANAEATARLVDRISDAVVFTAGDNAYFNGTAAEFANCYGPRWGRFKGRTYPTAGNHEYQVSAAPYFDYFGDRAGPRGAGYYSYTLGNWHIIALNSNIPATDGSEQLTWLRQDLEANKRVVDQTGAKCQLAYWHHPLFTSGPSAGSNALMLPAWRALYAFGVDVIVNGHDHLYERFDAMDPTGRRDLPAGIRQYTVGTGGALDLYDFGAILPTSIARLKAYGIVRFTLRDAGWDSVFIQAGNELQFDVTGGNLCH